MTMDILSDKVVTTRKAHQCNACLRRFPSGSRMRTQVNTLDGIGTWRECQTCTSLLSTRPFYFRGQFDVIFEEGCVAEALEIGETPEGLLMTFTNQEAAGLR